jgi:hypothetical protein
VYNLKPSIMNTSKPEILLLNYLTPSSTDCILLFGNGLFRKAIITDEVLYRVGFSRTTQTMHKYGNWKQAPDGIQLIFEEKSPHNLIYSKSAGFYFIKDGSKRAYYYPSKSHELINLALLRLRKQVLTNETA